MTKNYDSTLMLRGRYRKHSLLSLILIIIITLSLSLPFINYIGFLRFRPFGINNSAFQIAFIIIMIGVSSIIGGILTSYLLSPMYLFFHKIIFGYNKEFGIVDKPVPEKFRPLSMVLFPALMAMNFSLLFSTNSTVIQVVVHWDYINSLGGYSNEVFAILSVITFISLLILTSGAAVGLFAPAWTLQDAGIVYANKDRDSTHNIEVRSVGSWYQWVLKGYSGISVILAFIVFLTAIYFNAPQGSLIDVYRTVLPMPLLLMLMTLPTVIILDKIRSHRIRFILRVARKLGIQDRVSVKYEKIKKTTDIEESNI
ncbi:MAG: hypothetical protein GF411_16645 [Candidatus Lokiarchaeota archaeon]|nr:hypothetical protein [Candidatus Lokiarchaeota archaeon]